LLVVIRHDYFLPLEQATKNRLTVEVSG
jgi:hypothetical protein